MSQGKRRQKDKEEKQEPPSISSDDVNEEEAARPFGRNQDTVGMKQVDSEQEDSPSGDGSNISDVIKASIASMPRKAEWKADCAITLPQFSLVEQNRKSVEEWCSQTQNVLNEYWSPTGLIIHSLMGVVKLPEFRQDTFEPSKYNVSTFLAFIKDTWNRRYAKCAVEIVLEKSSSESWCDFHD